MQCSSTKTLLQLIGRELSIDFTRVEESQQILRVSARDHLTDAQIGKILNAQVDRATRLRGADDVIENNGNLLELIEATERLHEQYLELAKKA